MTTLKNSRGSQTRRSIRRDGNLMVSQTFAQCLNVFRECSDAVQRVVLEMATICDDPDATADEREAALATIAEALFPSGWDGVGGEDLEEAERRASPEPSQRM